VDSRTDGSPCIACTSNQFCVRTKVGPPTFGGRIFTTFTDEPTSCLFPMLVSIGKEELWHDPVV